MPIARPSVLRIWLPLAFLAGTFAATTGAAHAGVTNGPSYVQVPGSPFAVGGVVDAIALNPAGNTLAAADLLGDDIDTLSLDGSTGALAASSSSPFAAGRGPDSVAFSPGGQLLAAANLVDDTVSVFSVSTGGVLTPVGGSPFATGNEPRAIAFNPAGNLLAVANGADDTVSVFAVGAAGALTPVPGSPFATGASPVALGFSPGGNLLAVADEGDGTVSIFTVGAGTLTPSAGSPLTAGDGPAAVAFNPSGSLLAVANSAASTVSVFATGVDAASFSEVPGSPFATGAEPVSVAFDGTGSALATADSLDGTVAVFTVGAGGSLSLEQGAPFPSGNGPHSVVFVPNSSLLAVADAGTGSVSVLGPMPPPTATIVAPTAGQSFTRGQVVQTRFYCLDSTPGPGLASCTDASGGSAPFGVLPTSTLGTHTYTITGASIDGLTATTSVSYVVTPAPPKNRKPPQVGGKAVVGKLLSCSRGTWTGQPTPTKFTYQWTRNGVPLAASARASYRITDLDRGSQLACSVTAYNGSSAPATSLGISVPLHQSANCPAPSGPVTGPSLGPLKLGDTAAQAKRAMKGSSDRPSPGGRKFCLTPAPVTIGFPTGNLRKVLHGGPPAGHMVWALTANPLYSYSGVAPGISLATAEQQLAGGTTQAHGATSFYLVRQTKATIVLEATGGVVTQIGIADNRTTSTATAIAALVASLPT